MARRIWRSLSRFFAEAFARFTMLYIPCTVNSTQVKAFIDSVAKSTIMSSARLTTMRMTMKQRDVIQKGGAK